MKTQIIAAILKKDGKYLVGKRSSWKKIAPGYWCPVFGGIETGETEEAAVIREVFEELCVRVEPIKKIRAMDTNDHTGTIHWWYVKILSGEPTLANNEHSELRWVTIEELAQLTPTFAEDVEVFRIVDRSGI